MAIAKLARFLTQTGQETVSCRSPHMPSEVRFTRAQRWDLVRISAAAVASTVFFSVPMFLVRPHPTTAQTESRPSEHQDIALPTISEPQARSNAASAPTAVPWAATEASAVSVVTATEFAEATTPSLQNRTTLARRAGKPAEVRARANTAPTAPSLSRRFARFIAGSGKYNVKPFPTLNTSGS
jgi:hypothetical protein